MQLPDLSNIPELKPVEPGEYDLRIKKAIDKTSNGRKMIVLAIDIIDHPEAETIFHNLTLPKETDDEDKAAVMNRMVRDFIVAIGLDPASTTTEDFNGIEFTAILKIDTYEERESNKIARII